MRAQSYQKPAATQRALAIFSFAVILMLALASCTPAASTATPDVPVTASSATPEMATAEPTEAATEAPAAMAPSEVNLKFDENAEFGPILVDDKGMSLYLFTKDTPNTSNCEGDCLAAWPPLLVEEGGAVNVEGADDPSMFGTTTRSDGSTQVTFNSWPLYYWVNDTAPGQTTGQGVGDVWYLMDPAGNGIGMPGAATEEPAASGAAPAEVNLKFEDNSEFGKYLVDDKGMALYLFTKDTPNTSNCEGDCLANWPALLVEDGGAVNVTGADDDSMFGTTKRSDGSTQVTFNGWPLYYWVKDTKPGDTTGQGVGDVWYLMDPAGNGIGAPAPVSSSSNESEDYPQSAPSSASAASDEVKLMVQEDAALGKFLVDEKGMTLYLFTKDEPGVSNCEGQCLVNWPPLLVAEGGKVEIDGMDEEGLVGTITRSDGTVQVTYKEMPLYYWVKDTKPGDTTGQGVGDVWFVVEP